MTPIHNEEERERQVAAIKRSRRVPYGDIELAVKVAKRTFPEARDVVGRLYSGAPYVEVYDEVGAAKIFFVDVDAEEVLAHQVKPIRRNRGSRARSKAERPVAA